MFKIFIATIILFTSSCSWVRFDNDWAEWKGYKKELDFPAE